MVWDGNTTAEELHETGCHNSRGVFCRGVPSATILVESVLLYENI